MRGVPVRRAPGRGAGAHPGAPAAKETQAVLEHFAAGRHAEVENAARQMIERYPRHPFGWKALGAVLCRSARHEQALPVLEKALERAPGDGDVLNNLGKVLTDLGRPQQALEYLQRLLQQSPGHVQGHNNLGNAWMQLGQPQQALEQYRQALALQPDAALVHNNLGNALMALGRAAEAERSFLQALRLQPDFAAAHYNLGKVYRYLERPDAALLHLQRACALAPEQVECWINLANLLFDQGRVAEARAGYRQMLGLHPEAPEAHANYLEFLDKSAAWDLLPEALARAQAICPEHPMIALSQARLLRRDGEFARARACLEAMAVPQEFPQWAALRAYALAELCDRLGDAGAAIASASEGNHWAQVRDVRRASDPERFRQRLQQLQARFQPAWIAHWTPCVPMDVLPDPVFLVGFPRSGTTLLDTILRGHSQVAVVEEAPASVALRRALAQLPGGDPEALADLDAASLTRLRTVYWEELARHLEKSERGRRVVIDKLPLNLCEAGLLQRVFPQARFLFALRHPCDCVLSAFMQNFSLNDAMSHFLRLEDAAALYGQVMELWEHYRAILPLRVCSVRYEDLLEAFEPTLRPVLAFLELGWEDSLHRHVDTARRRERIHTPSYTQVTEELYTRARGRWVRYQQELDGVLPLLLRWAERYGY